MFKPKLLLMLILVSIQRVCKDETFTINTFIVVYRQKINPAQVFMSQYIIL